MTTDPPDLLVEAGADEASAPGPDPATAVDVGIVTTAHGLRGELKVEPLTDFPERFERGSRLWLAGVERRVQASRWQDRNVILKLRGVNDRTAAEKLRGQTLQASQPVKIDAEERRYYLHDIIGLPVQTAAGERLGELAEVLTTGANDVYVVRGERGELLLPAIEDVVLEVDIAAGRIVVELLPGLEFQSPKSPAAPRRSRPKTG